MIERSFRVEEGMYEQLKEIGESEGLPVSYLLRVALARFLDEYGDGVPLIEVRGVDKTA